MKIMKNNDGIVKGIELKPEINNKAIGKVIPSSTLTTEAIIRKSKPHKDLLS